MKKKAKRRKKGNLSTRISFDPITKQISQLLLGIPRVGEKLAGLYLWKPMMFNFMLVGASGTVLSWLLYEGFFRVLLLSLPFGTFIGMVITTCLVFLWNYTWNKRWSLNSDAQILKMKKHELQTLRTKVDELLSKRFDEKGNRL